MKAFWWSLLGFCILMCSCTAKKVAKTMQMTEVSGSQLTNISWAEKTDTFFSHLVNKSTEYKFIKETIMYRKYDKETGNIAEETVETREFAQDTQTDIEAGSHGKVTETSADSLEKVENVGTETEMNEASVIESGASSFWEKFGKWIGIVLGCVIGLLVVYLLKQNRVN